MRDPVNLTRRAMVRSMAMSRGGTEWIDSYLANGNFGQFILGLPAIDMVIVHRRAVTESRTWL
jgi:hypothetical protein